EADAPRLKPAPGLTRPVLESVLRAGEHASTVPRRCCDPGPSEALERAPCGTCGLTMVEEPVDGWTGSADVCAESAERPQLFCERRRHEVVRRQCAQVTGPADVLERVEEGVAPPVPSVGSTAFVERRVAPCRPPLARVRRE